MNPLSKVSSLKLRLGIVIVAAILVAVAVMAAITAADLSPAIGVVAAVPAALIVVRVLARGMTSPLREMARAADAMARGDHGHEVTEHGNDEVAQLARAFNAMSRELAETDRQRRELIATVSHELRTPLSALQATLENLVDGVEENSPERLRAMQQQVARLGRMVNQLLDLSRIESEGRPLSMHSFKVERLLERVTDEAEQAPRFGLAIDVSTEPPELELVADEERMHQVLGNLLANAVRFSPKDKPVGLTATRARSRDRVRFEVSDAGPGIPASERLRVFDRFYSADSSRSGDGAGLGLAITKWIVDLHGGEIWIDSEYTEGCRVVVEVPRSGAVEEVSGA